MGFADDLRRAAAIPEGRVHELVPRIALLAKESIQVGSPLTGAPGQPVDTATLRNSWLMEMESPSRALVSTNVEYAQAVEDGVGPHGRVVYGKSGVGGSHSVRLTVAAGQQLADAAVRSLP